MTRARKSMLIAWLATLVTAVALSQLHGWNPALDRYFPPFVIIRISAKIGFVVLSAYVLALAIRYVLRKLFWRVGRRLALSYFLIGVLPFVLFAILVVVIGYSIGGILSQAAFRMERQAFLARLDAWNLEYAVSGRAPGNVPAGLKIYDVPPGSKSELPAWLQNGSFTGLAIRDQEVVFVSSRLYAEGGKRRTITIVEPFDERWAKQLEEKSGMVVRHSVTSSGGDEQAASGDSKGKLVIQRNEKRNLEANVDDAIMKSFFSKAMSPRGVVWGDLAPLVEWTTGEQDPDRQVFSFIWNPWSSLVEFYFIGSSEYARGVFGVMAGIATSLLLLYLPATLLAAVLIFSISRAVNRIEKGTKAVERGDFSYRIGMKPSNQLGEMAQSFDRMTESISSLLVRVAGQERLQSEIDIAASIQRNLLPKEGPRFRGVSFAAHFEPTAQIGGDYYDVFNLDHSRLAVAIGDVSGHGLSTGLVMAMVKAAITTLVEEGADEVSLFRRLNELVFRSTEKRAFMTLAFTIFDLERGTVRHTNAGHLYPYLVRAGEAPLPIESPSLPLGVRHDIEPTTVEMKLEQGDTFVYLSDGIIEAQDEHGEPLGFDHLEAVLREHSGGDPAAIQLAILDATAEHSGARAADDDRTVMVLRFDQLAAAEEEPADRVAGLHGV